MERQIKHGQSVKVAANREIAWQLPQGVLIWEYIQTNAEASVPRARVLEVVHSKASFTFTFHRLMYSTCLALNVQASEEKMVGFIVDMLTTW